tara:strand:- start:109 stop:573 length:465 start_codon:yes stop_codon:yes gene_type:complete
MNKFLLTSFLFLLFLTHCGFSVISNNANYNILELITEGDKKINYSLKNKLQQTSKKNNENNLKLEIDTKKIKTIKEKNISNQITKYEIKIVTKIKYSIISKEISGSFNISKSGIYNVSSRHSETLNNENNLIGLLVDDLSENILENLAAEINDL